MRVGIVGLLHESNTFIARETTWDDFAADILLRGEAVRDRLMGTHHELGGFFEGLARRGCTAVPLFAARAVPYGPIAEDCFERLSADMLEQIDAAGPFDGLLAALHGAAVSTSALDADGELLSRLRKRMPSCPLMVTLDAHANLSPRMVASCDAIIGYRTNPHLDQRERGIEAAHLMARTLSGEVHPVMAAEFPPLAINIERQCTSEPHWQPILSDADRIRNNDAILSASLFLGFPYADVEEMGSATVVVADGDAGRAATAARDLAASLWRRRHELVGKLLTIDEALEQAVKLPPPVCLLDMGDNVGGGSPGDGTLLADAIRQRNLRGLVCLCDPEAVRRAVQIGVGGIADMEVGGKSDTLHGPPLRDAFRVVSIQDGRFEEDQPRHGGARHFDQGTTVVLETERGLTVMLISRRVPPFSLKQLTSFGVQPGAYRVVVAKGVNAPIAAYREVCRQFLRVDTPGVTSANLERLTFHRRRRPMFPFEPDTAWNEL